MKMMRCCSSTFLAFATIAYSAFNVKAKQSVTEIYFGEEDRRLETGENRLLADESQQILADFDGDSDPVLCGDYYTCSHWEGWDDGVRSFMDPLPVGASPNSMTVTMYGACSSTVDFIFNGVNLGSFTDTFSSCIYNDCYSTSIQTDVVDSYVLEDMNTFQLVVTSGPYVCVDRVEIVIEYDPPECMSVDGREIYRTGTATCSSVNGYGCSNVAIAEGHNANAVAGTASGNNCNSATAKGVGAVAMITGTSNVAEASGDGSFASIEGNVNSVKASAPNSSVKLEESYSNTLTAFPTAAGAEILVQGGNQQTINVEAPNGMVTTENTYSNTLFIKESGIGASINVEGGNTQTINVFAESGTATVKDSYSNTIFINETGEGATINVEGGNQNTLNAFGPGSLVEAIDGYQNVVYTLEAAADSTARVEIGNNNNVGAHIPGAVAEVANDSWKNVVVD